MAHTYTGTAGDDNLTGTSLSDDFVMYQGGVDTVSGGGGNDRFFFEATFTADDRVNGGSGDKDLLYLNGDYSGGLVFGAETMVSVENLTLGGGHSYALSGLTDANDFTSLTVDAHLLGAGDSLAFDGSALVHGALDIQGGAGADVLTGGQANDTLDGGLGNDSIRGGQGDDFISSGRGADTLGGGQGNDLFHVDADGAATIQAGEGDDRINDTGFTGAGLFDGGGGHDSLTIGDEYGIGKETYVLSGSQILNIETIYIGGASTVTTDGTLTAKGQVLDVSAGTQFQTGFNGMRFVGHLERGDLVLTGSIHRDVLTGGAGNDTIVGSGGPDLITGGKGADLLDGGTSEGVTYIYKSIKDSKVAAPDTIASLDSDGGIDLHRIDADTTQGGDQAFHLVSSLDGHAGELVLTYSAESDQTTLAGDVDGDGAADFSILIDGDHHSFTGFVF